MSNVLATTVQGHDGTEIPVDWVYPGAEECTWEWNREHREVPDTPIELWFFQHGTAGADRAWEEAELVPSPAHFRRQYAGPFQYLRLTPYPAARMAEFRAGQARAIQRFGSPAEFWRQYCQPRIQQSCRELANASSETPMRSLAEVWAYGLWQTFTSASVLRGAFQRLSDLLAESVGMPDASLLANELVQGGANASQVIDAEIWELAAIARQTPEVKRHLESSGEVDVLSAIRAETSGAAFIAAFDALLDRHGSRSLGWQLTLPTWREQPAAPLALIRSQLSAAGVSPTELTARSAARRGHATAVALAAIPEDKRAEFDGLVAELAGYVGVREDRAYWQMTLTGEARGVLLRRGADLVRVGRCDRVDDVFFLVPEEFENESADDLRSLVSERRAEWQQWHQITPPSHIGVPIGQAARADDPGDELRGVPASRGQVTGPVRILHSLEDAALLQPGEVLVCVMTTPAWTPLFAIAGGVITETGGPLSHPAITAREYAIPAVLALKDATKRMRDGQIVTMDGSSGLIVLQP